MAVTYDPNQEEAAVALLNTRLRDIASWGERWQVRFAPHKTQLMLITRSATEMHLNFNGKVICTQNEIEILGVTYDSKLQYKTHIENVARKASAKLTSMRRMSWLLNKKGKEVLYKAQVRSAMEYSMLAWGGAANIHLKLLDKVQRRAIRMIEDNSPFLDKIQAWKSTAP